MRFQLTKVLPRHRRRLPPFGRVGGMTMEGDEPSQFVWDELVPRSIHPLTVAIIEAMLWIETPLSSVELREVFAGQFSLSLVAYHLTKLAEAGTVTQAGTIKQIGQDSADGAVQKVYAFPGGARRGSRSLTSA